ncbi:MAG: hypothetical protein R3E09_13520 [Novosphingobium sp.]
MSLAWESFEEIVGRFGCNRLVKRWNAAPYEHFKGDEARHDLAHSLDLSRLDGIRDRAARTAGASGPALE